MGKGFDFLGGLFDFNKDGKTDLGEMWVANKMYEEMTKEEHTDFHFRQSSTSFSPPTNVTLDFDGEEEDELDDDPILVALDDLISSLQAKKSDWREDCEDGSEHLIFPEDFETQDEYEEALEEAKADFMSISEENIAYQNKTEMANEKVLEEKEEDWQEYCEDGSDYMIFSENYDTLEEYEEALHEEKYGWRDICEDGIPYHLDPEDFETQDEYEEAVGEVKAECVRISVPNIAFLPKTENVNQEDTEYERDVDANKKVISGNITLNFSLKGQDDLDKISIDDFLNKRTYEAARYLAEINLGTAYIPTDSTVKFEMEKCQFILTNNSIASQYLTLFSGFAPVQ